MQDSTPSWAKDVLHFWFEELERAQWFQGSSQLDAKIASRFEERLERLASTQEDVILDEGPLATLAAVIVLDQFSRNIYRKQARAFAQDPHALTIAREAIARGFDQELEPEKRHFLYMPFMHAEDLDAQERSIELFGPLGDENTMQYAREHRDLIERFGRFPYRNEVLGRESTEEELVYLEEGKRYGQ